MAKISRWNDGRSGKSGRVAGNLVLDHLDPSGTRISHLKGTVFADSQNCWIGRVVADDSYLSSGVAHWANISADQQLQLVHEAKEEGRKLYYLFITAHTKMNTVRYWQVPAEVLVRELIRRSKNDQGDVLGLHISCRDGGYLLGEEDVSDCMSEFIVNLNDSASLNSAVEADRSRKKQTNSSIAKPAAQHSMEKARRFDVPISDGRVVTLLAPVPMSKSDVDRIKNYVDVIADLLV